MMIWSAGIAAGLLAILHLFAHRFTILDVVPRSRWLSIAGGISVAYVFVHVLPELSAHQRTLATPLSLAYENVLIYLLALVGLVVFYALERLAVQSRGRQSGNIDTNATETGVFWIHISAFALYNLLIGYLLVYRNEQGIMNMLLYAFALGVHFVVNDYGLRQHHKAQYVQRGRWLLAASIGIGWGLGHLVKVPDPWMVLLFSLLSGGIILNVLKEELPRERESRLSMFVLGVLLYTLVLMVVV